MNTLVGHVVRERRIWDLYLVLDHGYLYEAFDGERTLVLSEDTVVTFIDSSQAWIPATPPRRA